MDNSNYIAKPTRRERIDNPLKPTFPKKEKSKGLRPVGRRGKRLGKPDHAMQELIRDKPCICGCNADPLEGEVCRVHLESRSYESTRNEEWNNLPGCLAMNRWLDQTELGVQCRAVLLAMAKHKWEHHGEPLIHAEVWVVLDSFGWYGYRAKYGR